MVKQGQDAPEGGGLAGAGSPGEQQNLLLGSGGHCLDLEGGVGDALLPLDAPQKLFQVPGRAEGLPVHAQELTGHIALAVVETGQIAGVLPGDLLPDDLSPVDEIVQALLQILLGQAQQHAGGGEELGVGEKDVAVVQVVGEGIE